MATYVVGDIHGNLKALKEVLGFSCFNPKEDTLIGIGDYVDGQKDVYGCLEYLHNLPRFKGVIGNHDIWFREWLKEPNKIEKLNMSWYNQGGKATLDSISEGIQDFVNPLYSWYNPKSAEESNLYLNNILEKHKWIGEFIDNLKPYLIEEVNGKRFLFVHGGVPQQIPDITLCKEIDLCWDREMWKYHNKNKSADERLRRVYPIYNGYDHVIIGHTSHTKQIKTTHRLINIDTGAGWNKSLTLLRLDDMRLFESNPSHYDFIPQ